MATVKNKVSNFVTKVLASLNKDEKTRQQEQVEQFVKRAKLDCKQQISIRENKLANLKLDLEIAQSKLEHAQQDFEQVRFSIASDFSSYISKRNEKEEVISNREKEISTLVSQSAVLQQEIEKLNEVLVDFS